MTPQTPTRSKPLHAAILIVALTLICGTAGGLTWLRAHQRLGKPGIKATPIPGSLSMNIELPERVLDFTSTNIPESEVELGYFPKDTSYARRMYQSPDGFLSSATVVMMGADRTSIHQPDFCLPGQGWTIRQKSVENIPLTNSTAQLPVAKWVVSNELQAPDGNKVAVSGIYIFWLVADGAQTPSHSRFIREASLHTLFTGELQRWAYVSFFSYCAPGEEEATFEKMKALIGAAAPEFQLSAKPGSMPVAVTRQ